MNQDDGAMTILIVCLIIMIILSYLTKLPAAYAMNQLGGYNNHHPRVQASELRGFGARAVGSHQNSFEALTVFSTAVLTAMVTNHLGSTITNLAMFYVATRVVYHLMYLYDLAMLRSTVWFIGFICCLSILFLCLP